MKTYGIDFTSAPKRRKPITCIEGWFEGKSLHVRKLTTWPLFEGFEEALTKSGPWIAGIDFPFGQSRRFIENIGWPEAWADYVSHAKKLERKDFREALDSYKNNRLTGDKEHRRATDIAAGSISPQKLYGVPVGLMFFEGAPRLLEAGVNVPGLQQGDPDRIVVEAYPGVLARSIIERRSYKQDTKKKQTEEQRKARRDILQHITDGGLQERYGLTVSLGALAPGLFIDDPTGDNLDALLCCIQAAWAWTQRHRGYGAPEPLDPVEGWIADPALLSR